MAEIPTVLHASFLSHTRWMQTRQGPTPNARANIRTPSLGATTSSSLVARLRISRISHGAAPPVMPHTGVSAIASTRAACRSHQRKPLVVVFLMPPRMQQVVRRHVSRDLHGVFPLTTHASALSRLTRKLNVENPQTLFSKCACLNSI